MTISPYIDNEVHKSKRPGAVWALTANLAAGFRLAFFLRVKAESFRAELDQAGLLAVTVMATLSLTQFLTVLPYPEFNPAGMGTMAVSYAGFLLGVWVISAFARSPQLFLPLVVMLMAAQITMTVVLSIVVTAATNMMAGHGWLIGLWSVFAGALLWHMLIGLRAVRLLLETRLWRSLAMSVAYLAAVAGPLFTMPQIPLFLQTLQGLV